MKTMNFKLLTILLISLGFLAGCGEDKVKVSLFVGDYVITEALVAEEFTIPVTGVGNIPVAAGTNVTAAIQAALLSAVTCSSADKSYVELREDLSIVMSCEGANPLSAGTWSEVSATELKLNLNSTAVKPIGIVLPVTDVVKNDGILTGKTSVPLPNSMVEAIIKLVNPAWTLDDSALPIYQVKISLKFTQK
jgi:hypothetical protein